MARSPVMLTTVANEEAQQPPPKPKLFTDYTTAESLLETPLPPLDFVLPGLLGGTMGVLVSQGGVGKSMLGLGLGACVASGKRLWNLVDRDPKPGPVIVVSAEDPKVILAHRIHALAAVPGGTDLRADTAFKANFKFKAVQGTNFSFGTWNGSDFQASTDFEYLGLEIAEMRPRLVIFDTLNRCLAGITENDNAALGRIVSELEALVASCGAAALVLHHTSKGASREGQGDEQQAARGAGAITDNARWQGNLVGMSKDDAKKHGVEDEDRRRWVRWVVSKSNYAAPVEDRWLWRDQGGVLLGRDLPVIEKQTTRRGGKGRNHDDD